MSLVDTAMAKMQALPPERQQEIIDFIDFLLSRGPWAHIPPSQPITPSANESTSSVGPTQDTLSVLEAAGDLTGCVEGPTDLSTNPAYLRGYGT